jgi:hypothetical protein
MFAERPGQGASQGKRFHRQSARALVRGQSLLAAAFAGRPNGRIAQVVEQLTLNQRVVGSSPTAPTKIQIKTNRYIIGPRKSKSVGNIWAMFRAPETGFEKALENSD